MGSGWVDDPAYLADDKQPAMLDFEGAGSFTELVRTYSGDMTPRAVLDELMRVGVAAVEPDSGRLQLKQRAYVPAGDSEDMLQIFGEDVSDLVATIDHNLISRSAGKPPLFQRTLTYDNIPADVIERWREISAEQSQALLEQLDDWLGPHDRQGSGSQGEGANKVRTGVGIFYFEEPIQPDTSGDKRS